MTSTMMMDVSVFMANNFQPSLNIDANGEMNEKALKHLSMRYGGALNTHVAEVLACLKEIASPSDDKSASDEGSCENCEPNNVYDMMSVCGHTFRRMNALQRQYQSQYQSQSQYQYPSASYSQSPNTHSGRNEKSKTTPTKNFCAQGCDSPTNGGERIANATLPTSSSLTLVDHMASADLNSTEQKISSFSTIGRFLKTVTMRKSMCRKYSYKQHDGDLNASEMTMTENDRIQLMILVKEGKLSVQEAVETVKKYKKLEMDDEPYEEHVSTSQTAYLQASFVQRRTLSAMNTPSSSPNRVQPVGYASPKDRVKPSFISPLFLRRAHTKTATKDDGDQNVRCAIPVLHRRRNENGAQKNVTSELPSRGRHTRWSPPPLPPLPTGSGPIVESVSAEFSYCRTNGYLNSRMHDRPSVGNIRAAAIPASSVMSAVRKSHSLHSSSASTLHHLIATAEIRQRENEEDCTLMSGHIDESSGCRDVADQLRSPKRHTPPSGSTPESQVAKRQFVVKNGDCDVPSLGINDQSGEVSVRNTHTVYDTVCSQDDTLSYRNVVPNGYYRPVVDDYPPTDYDNNVLNRDNRTIIVKEQQSCLKDQLPIAAIDGSIKANDRVHSSMDSLINANSASTCGISSSSSHSSMSVDEELSSRMTSLNRVRARCDSRMTSSSGDVEALAFKKGDIIYLISLSESGVCRGIINNCIGTFNIADVEVLHEDGTLLASPRHGRPGKGRRGLRRQKPKTVEELLCRLGLQRLTSLFIISGFTTLDEFSELDESDLDELHVMQAEDRVKLLTAAQLLSDCDNTSSDLSGHPDDNDRSSNRSLSQSPAQSHDASCQTLSSVVSPSRVVSGVECPSSLDRSPPATMSADSRSDQESGSPSSSSARQRYNNASTSCSANLNGCADELHRSSYGDAVFTYRRPSTNSEGPKKRVTSPVDSRFVVGCSQARSASPSVRSAHVRQLVTGLPIPTGSVPTSSATGDWRGRLPAPTGGGAVVEAAATNMPALTRQHGQLVAAMLKMLSADKIDLSQPPYTHKFTGESGVPASLIRNYSDVLHSGRSEAVLAMEDCRQRALAAASAMDRKQNLTVAVALALPVDCSSSDSITDFLSALGLSTYAGHFATRGLVTVDQLRGLTAANLCEIGISSTQHVYRLIDAVEAISAIYERRRGDRRISSSSSSSLSHHPVPGGRQRAASGPTRIASLDGRAQRDSSVNFVGACSKIGKGTSPPAAAASKFVDRV